ncbi:CCA tRNA nucleotidyltransferase, mitochondrial [Batrachochytrium dendrobatidis]|nr:CCA tRNA nucleotidyltransferase, mitochondrial [Batrachochytrium dendrobatidis]
MTRLPLILDIPHESGHLSTLSSVLKLLLAFVTHDTACESKLNSLLSCLQDLENKSQLDLLDIYSEIALVTESLMAKTVEHDLIANTIRALADCIHQLNPHVQIESAIYDDIMYLIVQASKHAHVNICSSAWYLLRQLISLPSQSAAASKDVTREIMLKGCGSQHDTVRIEAVQCLAGAYAIHKIYLDDYIRVCAHLMIKAPECMTESVLFDIRQIQTVRSYAQKLCKKIFSKDGLDDTDTEAQLLLARGIIATLPDLINDQEFVLIMLNWIISQFQLKSILSSESKLTLELLGSLLASESICTVMRSIFLENSDNCDYKVSSAYWNIFVGLVESRITNPQSTGTIDFSLKDNEASSEIVHTCVNALDVPSIFGSESGWSCKPATQFVTLAPRILTVLLWLHIPVHSISQSKFRTTNSIIRRILIACGQFTFKPISIWSTTEIQSLTHQILDHLVTITKHLDLSSLVSDHAESILTTYIKPLFLHASFDENGNLSKPQTNLLQLDDSDKYFGKRQLWKEEKVGCVSVLAFCCLMLRAFRISELLYLIFPPILSLLDDHEAKFKLFGVQLAKHCFIIESTPKDLGSSGLGLVLFEALSVGTLYMSQYELMSESFEAARLLLPRIHNSNSAAFALAIDAHLRERVVARFTFAVGLQVIAMRVLFRESCELIRLCPILVFKYLKVLLNLALDVLEINQRDVETQTMAANTLLLLIELGWARISMYQGKIIKSVAESWRLLHLDIMTTRVDSDALAGLKQKLQRAVTMMYQCTTNQTEMDLQILFMIDGKLFGALSPKLYSSWSERFKKSETIK